jgi:PncC family amidohydrolase
VKPEGRLGMLLSERRLRLAVAESCTGGLIASRITDIAGSSDYFEAGVVVYSNQAKQKFLSVPAASIEAHGAVSREVAESMAEGVRVVTGADIGLSVTGIAGPKGGSPEKPVGTVFIGLAAKAGTGAGAKATTQARTVVRQFHFNGGRLEIKEQTSTEALRLAIDFLEGSIA